MKLPKFIRRLFGLEENLSPTDIYGSPVDWEKVYAVPGLARPIAPVFGPETRPDRNSALRTISDHHRARNLCRALAELNPNCAGAIDRITDYAIGCGSTTEVHGTDENPDVPKRLSKQVKQCNDGFKRHNDWLGVEQEIIRRLITDGEFFLRIVPDATTLADEPYVTPTDVYFVEPAQVIPPAGESHDGPWSFGIHIPDGMYKPVAYNVHDYRDGTDEVVEAQFIVHGKADGLRNAKRGIPMLWAALEELQGSARLRYTAREGEKARQAVAYFRSHDTATKQIIQSLQDEVATDQYTRHGTRGDTEVLLQRMEPGSVVDIPKGLVPQPPPTSPAQGTETIVRLSLEAVAARLGVPLWVVSASTDSANFAVSLTAESPLVKSLERWQRKVSDYSDDAQTRALEIAIEQGLLPEDTLDRVDLLVTLPSPVTRNKKEESDRRDLLHTKGVISLSTWRSEEGYDEQEAEKIAQERESLPPQLPDTVRATDDLDVPNGASSSPATATQGTQTAPGATPAAGGTGDVQDTALNGAQVASLLEIVTAISAGTLPPDAGRALIQAAFPALRPEQVDAIVSNLTVPGSTPVPAGQLPAPAPAQPEQPPESEAAPASTPGAEYAGMVNRPEK